MSMKSRGFTLIEVIITVAIMVLLMGFGMPMYTQWNQNMQIRTAADSIINGLQQARNEAVRANQSMRFELTDTMSGAWRVCAWDGVNDACIGAPTQERSGAEGGKNARLGATAVEAVAVAHATPLDSGVGIPGGITFTPFGRLANPGLDLRRIDVRNPALAAEVERRLVVLVSVGGLIRMCDPKHNRATNAQGC
jgi:type IV fimbrial biogenesis protein FimT